MFLQNYLREPPCQHTGNAILSTVQFVKFKRPDNIMIDTEGKAFQVISPESSELIIMRIK